MRVNYIEPTREEIGDPFAAAARARAFRQQMYARKPLVQKPVDQPAKPMVIKLVSPTIILPKRRDDPHVYIMPIQGPCLPDHPQFQYYLGMRDILEIATDAQRVWVEDCIRYICKTELISRIELLSQRRMQAIVAPRQKLMWLCKKYTMRSLPEIGRKLGGRDHTTVLHAVRKYDAIVAAGGWTPPTSDEILSLVRPAALCAENAG